MSFGRSVRIGCVLATSVLLGTGVWAAGQLLQAEGQSEIVVAPPAGGKSVRMSTPQRLQEVLEGRLRVLLAERGAVNLDDAGRYHLRYPVARVTDAQLAWLCRPGSFRVVWMPNVQNAQRPDAPYSVSTYIVKGEPDYRFLDVRAGNFVSQAVVLKQARAIATGEELAPEGATLANPAPYPMVALQFNPAATKRLAAFARKHPRETIAFTLDGKLFAGPTAVPPPDQVIGPGGKRVSAAGPWDEGRLLLSPLFADPAEAAYLVAVLNSGALPAPLTLVEHTLILDETKSVVPVTAPDRQAVDTPAAVKAPQGKKRPSRSAAPTPPLPTKWAPAVPGARMR